MSTKNETGTGNNTLAPFEGGYDPYTIVMPTAMGVIIALAVVGISFPWIFSHYIRPAKNKSEVPNKRSKGKPWQVRFKRWLKEAFYVELKAPPSNETLVEMAINDVMQNKTDPKVGRDWERPIGPGCTVPEEEIRTCYPPAVNNEEESLADRAVLVLRLSLGLLACGHCTVDAESTALRVAMALKVPHPPISLGHRLLTAQFGASPAHVLTCERDFVFSTLASLQSFSEAIIVGEITDVKVALLVCDEILARPLPYGWLLFDICFWLIAPWAAIAAYYGTYWDMLGAAVNSPFVVLTYNFCRRFKIKHLENILVPFILGLVAPLTWRYISGHGQDLCHITPQYMAALLIHLPGAEIVWGALELLQGSATHGASRLVKGLMSAISLAVFVTLGWQVFGRNLASGWLYNEFYQPLSMDEQKGSIASLPDSQWCPYPPYPTDDPLHPYPSYFSWQLIVGIYNIPLNILCLINVYIPPRQWLGPFVVGQVGLLALGYLQFQCTPDTCQVPGIIQNLLAAFAATFVAMGVEVLQGLPSAVSIIPVLFIFAPGSMAVLSAIGWIHRSSGDVVNTNENSWGSLTMQAFSYGVGIYLGQEVWSSFISARFKNRALRIREKQNEEAVVDSKKGLKVRGNPQVAHGHGSMTTKKYDLNGPKISRKERTSSVEDRDDSDSINLREGFHSPQVMHGMGEMTQFVFSSVYEPTDKGSGEEKETEMQDL